MSILVTGAAGFIGSSTARALLARGEQVVGIDNLNDYYDPALKQARLDALSRDFGNRLRASNRSISATQDALDELRRAPPTSTASSTSARRRRPLLADQPAGLCPLQPGRPRSTCSSWPARRGVEPFRLCQLVVGLWRQQDPAVPGRGPRRPSALALRRDQEGRRADERKLRHICSGCR